MKASKQRHFNNARTNCSVPQPFGLRNGLKKIKISWKFSSFRHLEWVDRAQGVPADTEQAGQELISYGSPRSDFPAFLALSCKGTGTAPQGVRPRVLFGHPQLLCRVVHSFLPPHSSDLQCNQPYLPTACALLRHLSFNAAAGVSRVWFAKVSPIKFTRK